MQKLIIGCLAACLAVTTSVASAQQNRANQPNGRANNRMRQEIIRWTEQAMPNLFQLVNDPQGRSYFSEAQNHYRTFQGARDDKTKDRILTSYKQEDEIFGFVLELRQAKDDEKPAIRERINQATLRLVQGFLDERQSHIDSLQKQITDQERKLAEDRKNIDKLVEARVNSRFLKEGSTTRPSSEPPSNSSQPSSAPRGGGTLASPEQAP